MTDPASPSRRKPLRVWPGVVALVAVGVTRFGVKAVVPGFEGFSRGMQWSFWAMGAVLLWWLLASRARWFERLGAVAVAAGAAFAAWELQHPSMGPFWGFAYLPHSLCLALVGGALVARRLHGPARWATLAGAILVGGLAWTLVRMDGISGDHASRFGWRWSPSAEERLLAHARRESATQPSLAPTAQAGAAGPASPAATPNSAPPARAAAATHSAASTPVPKQTTAPDPDPAALVPSIETTPAGDWPGFRGPGRDGVVRGPRIATDWAATPPVELWRREVGPGWSSIAVGGSRIYTQEQHGDDEVVACYEAATGAPVWTHRDKARFYETAGGAGPRGTPTLHGGRVYTLGATGILNALDADDGAIAWSRDAAADGEATPSMTGGKTKVPDWGFSSSPLVIGELLVVAVAGQLVAYDHASGERRWTGPAGGTSYSSPFLASIGGVPQVLLMSGKGLTSLAPADGQPLWEHKWRGFPIVQPALLGDGGLLVVAQGTSGTRRLAVERGAGGWSVEERWTSAAFKPYFNDFVVHEGHAYGFDGRILACIDVADGRRKWKGGRYGSGQLVLLPDQDVLLVLSEEGELALVRAAPDAFTELSRARAIEGKTWNHPALVGDLLLVRNGAEMAAFRLPRSGG
jgi:outer membrane protein assembly factor BamB